jgi:putative GTP pyrophosphokinase
MEKCSRKSYSNPREEMTDISGIRIITFLESQVAQIIELVRANFDVDEKNSLDKRRFLVQIELDTDLCILSAH